MPLSLKTTSAPVAEPVTLDQAKYQLNIDLTDTDNDTFITGLIPAARHYVEKKMKRSIFDRSMSYWLDAFPLPYMAGTHGRFRGPLTWFKHFNDINTIEVPQPGLVSVASITYLDDNMAMQTLDPSTYYVDVNSEPGRIRPMQGNIWPIANLYASNVVQINYVSGTWGDGVEVNNCPEDVMQAMMLLISHWYTNRDAAAVAVPRQIELGVESLLQGHVFEGGPNH